MISYVRERIDNTSMEVRNRFDSTRNKIQGTITEIRLWIPRKISEVSQKILQLFYIGLQLLIALVIVLILSCLLYYVIKSRLVPRAVIKEPVHMDYLSTPPTARISLNKIEKQWSYIDHSTSIEPMNNNSELSTSEHLRVSSLVRDKRYLKSGNKYFADMTFILAKSANNYAQGKFMVTLTMIDALGKPIATSIRPVIMPYQAPHVTYIDSLVQYVTFPFYRRQDLVTVHLTMMNDYEEPGLHVAGTDQVEVRVSSATFDLMETHITLMPRLRGVTYYLFHYPRLSFVVGVWLLTTIQIAVYSSAFLVALLVRHMMHSGTAADGGTGGETSSNDEEDEEERGGNSSKAARNRRGRLTRKLVGGSDSSSRVPDTLEPAASSISSTSRRSDRSEGSSSSTPSSVVNVIDSDGEPLFQSVAATSAESGEEAVGLRRRGPVVGRPVSPSAESVD